MEINVLTFSYKNYGNIENSYYEDFKKYAEKHNLNTTVNVEVIMYDNPTSTITNFKLLVESSLKKSISNEKNNTKIDVYFYDARLTHLYSPYLLNLEKNLSKEFIEMYNSEIVEKISTYNNELIGLVIIVNK